MKQVHCILRCTAADGWYILNDAEHKPLGVSRIVADSEKLTLFYDFTGKAIHSFHVDPDETYIKTPLKFGPSVGLSYAYIYIGKDGSAAWQNPLNYADHPAGSNLWVSGFFS